MSFFKVSGCELVLSRSLNITTAYIYVCHLYTFYEGWNFNSGNYLFTTDTK